MESNTIKRIEKVMNKEIRALSKGEVHKDLKFGLKSKNEVSDIAKKIRAVKYEYGTKYSYKPNESITFNINISGNLIDKIIYIPEIEKAFLKASAMAIYEEDIKNIENSIKFCQNFAKMFHKIYNCSVITGIENIEIVLEQKGYAVKTDYNTIKATVNKKSETVSITKALMLNSISKKTFDKDFEYSVKDTNSKIIEDIKQGIEKFIIDTKRQQHRCI